MIELVLVLATTVLPVLVVIAKDVYVKRKEAARLEAPALRQGAVDVEILSDKSAFSVRLSRLHDAIRRRDPQRSAPPDGL